jgi:glycosyltransferase involved in cell wall biosynthesis
MSYCHRHGIPFFVRNDSNIRGEPRLSPLKSFVKRTLYAWWIKRAAGVCSMGKLGDEFFVKYGADPKRLYRVPYWPDYDAFTTADKDALARFKRKFGLNDQRRYLVYSGRLVPQKRVDLLIDAFAGIAAERPEWDLLIVGDGVLGQELRSRVPEGLRQRVVWCGFLDGDQPALAYHCGDVLVLPSESEPWALVVQEAMAAGLAVVASDVVGAAHELIRGDVGGRIFRSGDCDSLRNALLEVTAADRIDEIKREAAAALEDYRYEVDPVAEIRRALCDVGVLNKKGPPSEARILKDCSSNA